jgi:threonine dehydratase
VPIGGGGLAAGLASYFADQKKVQVIGCQPKNASEMYDSLIANRIVPPSNLNTIADASAGGIEANSATFTICKNLVSGFELLDEEAIKIAVAFAMKYHLRIIEPSAALPIAALLGSKKYSGKNVVLVLTGKKINEQLLKEIISDYGHHY